MLVLGPRLVGNSAIDGPKLEGSRRRLKPIEYYMFYRSAPRIILQIMDISLQNCVGCGWLFDSMELARLGSKPERKH
jgi:hypothetical protein